MRHAFTLVELSIVLVILGLLVGGVLAGQNLIRAAELRSVVTEHNQFQTAIMAFREKYFALPGDMKNAEAFWGTASACPGDESSPSTDGSTCNGDGDGNVEVAGLEIYRFWQHLATAGLIEGTFTGVNNAAAIWSVAPDSNAPSSRLSSGGYGIMANSQIAATGGWYNDILPPSSDHWLQFGIPHPSNSAYFNSPILLAEETWGIDKKIDDGIPNQGKVTVFNTDQNANCTISSNSAYNLSDTSIACTLFLGL